MKRAAQFTAALARCWRGSFADPGPIGDVGPGPRGPALGLLHLAFGLANFQPGFPKLEGMATITGGLALLTSLALARHSMYRASLTAFFGTLPLVAWFSYAVPIERSSGPVFFWASLVVTTIAGLAALRLRRRGHNNERDAVKPL